MACVWYVYGMCMIGVWHVYDGCMVYTWYMHGIYAWCMYGGRTVGVLWA